MKVMLSAVILASFALAVSAIFVYSGTTGEAVLGAIEGGIKGGIGNGIGGGIADGHVHYIDYYAAPHYAYDYSVHDLHSGDMNSQHETREGDHVNGYYTMHESEGTIGEVHYTADKHNGFNAEVKRIGHAHHAPVFGYHYGDHYNL